MGREALWGVWLGIFVQLMLCSSCSVVFARSVCLCFVLASDFLSCVGDIIFAAKDFNQLRLVVVNVALHNIHAGAK